MKQSEATRRLHRVLKELGVCAEHPSTSAESCFPACLRLKSGEEVPVYLSEPGTLALLNPGFVGAAVLDPQGFVRASWGLAQRVRYFDPLFSVLTTELGPYIEAALSGSSGSAYLDGYRFFASGFGAAKTNDVLVLVTNAQDERALKREVARSTREVEVLKRFGRVLSMNQSLEPLCIAAVHEIASATGLAAVLLWTCDSSFDSLLLSASTGVSRTGNAALGRLLVRGGSSCVAEIVADSTKSFYVPNAADHIMTVDLEANLCYLKAGGVSVHPLMIGGKVLGVIEFIGRDGDGSFSDAAELFQIVAEHLALALNSAMLFETFERMAGNDALTGIPNHRTLYHFLQTRIQEAERSGEQIGAIMIDVDHFRNFNEEEGHDVGDAVLRHVAELIQDLVRPYDLASRYGGEEFAVVLPASGHDATKSTAERIRQRMESVPFVTKSGRERFITVSLGSAIFPEDARDAAGLLKAADEALFEAKRLGRNRTCFFTEDLSRTRRADELNFDTVWELIPKRHQPAAKRRLTRLRPLLGRIARQFGLTETQERILEALVAFEKQYRSLNSSGGEAKLEKLRFAEGFRLLLPNFEAMDERYDGQGAQGTRGALIPLLARIVAVVSALDEHGPSGFKQFPGRFDPEIVDLVCGRKKAA